MTYSVIDFNEEIIAHFPPKFRWDDGQKKSWVAAMVRELSGFSPEALQRAARQLIAKHRDDRTPNVAKCIAACSEAKRWVDAEKNAGQLPIDGGQFSPGNLDWTAERLKLASELMNTPLGKQAAKEGWVGVLWSFARKNARLPQPGAEIEGCKTAAKGFDEAYALCVKNSHNPMMKKLEELGAEMLRRRHAIEQRVLR